MLARVASPWEFTGVRGRCSALRSFVGKGASDGGVDCSISGFALSAVRCFLLEGDCNGGERFRNGGHVDRVRRGARGHLLLSGLAVSAAGRNRDRQARRSGGAGCAAPQSDRRGVVRALRRRHRDADRARLRIPGLPTRARSGGPGRARPGDGNLPRRAPGRRESLRRSSRGDSRRSRDQPSALLRYAGA